MASQTISRPLSREERRRLLDERVRANVVRGGATVESHGEFEAVLVRGRRPNHILHLLLTVVTLGAWALVWIVLSLMMHRSRVLLTVDEYGNVSLVRARSR